MMSKLNDSNNFWLKSIKMLIINCHDLKVVAIQGRGNSSG